jgi:hypothetical protein
MKRQHMPLFAAALVIAIVGALAVGVPLSTVAFGLLVLCCPLMMLFMHGGTGGPRVGDGSNVGQPGTAAKDRDEHRPAGLR